MNFGAVGALFGLSAKGNPEQGYVDMFNYLNKHGGIDGHPVKAYYDYIDGSTNSSSAGQATCAYFTQDHKVDLVIGNGLALAGTATFVSCLAQAGIPLIDEGQDDYLSTSSYPNVFVPDAQTLGQQLRGMITTEVKRGFLTKKDRLGVLQEGCPDYVQAYQSTVVPLAKQYGIPVAQYQLSCYNGFSQLAGITAAIGGEVLKMKATGITKVMTITPSEGYVVDMASKDASQQHWYPGWILSSGAFAEGNSGGESLGFAGSEEPGMRGVGIWSRDDVGERAPTNAREAAAQRRCAKYSPSLGTANNYTGAEKQSVLESYYAQCDAVTVVKAMLTLDGVNFSVPLLAKVYAQAVASVASAADVGGQLRIKGSSRSGAFQAQPFGFSGKCSCFTPTGSLVAVS